MANLSILSKTLKLTIFSSLLIVSLLTIGLLSDVEAIVINSANIPAPYQTHGDSNRRRCRLNSSSPTYGHGENHWISRVNNPTNISPVQISYGTDSVTLQLNVLGNNCTSNMSIGGSPQSHATAPGASSYVTNRAIKRTRWNIVNGTATQGSVGGLPATLDILWASTYASPATSDRYYAKSSSSTSSDPVNAPFTLSGLSDLDPGTYNITVTVTSRVVNRYHADDPSGTHTCVSGGGTSSISGPGCGNAAASVTMQLVVLEDSGACTVTAPISVLPGATFNANFSVRNTGETNWATAGNPATHTTSNRYQLGNGLTQADSYFPIFDPLTYDGTAWESTNRVELPGDDIYGPVIMADSYSPPWTDTFYFTQSFRAPATAGTYTFGWHFVQRTVKHLYDSNCSTPIIVGTPPSVTCSLPSQTIQPGDQTTLTAGGGNGSFSWSAPGATSGSGTGGTFNYISNGTTGSYTVTVTSAGQNATCTVVVANKPYLRVYNGNIMAGAGFKFTDSSDSEGCATNNSARLLFFNKAGSPDYAGAGAQLAALAAGRIEGFASGVFRSSAPVPPKGLTFGSIGNVAANSPYGGGWNGATCAPDYYAKHTGAAVATNPISATNLATESQYTGNLTLNSGSLSAGEHNTLYVDGNVFIAGDITYAPYAGGAGAAFSQLPRFKLIVKGNIYVSPNVTQLDGAYIAQPKYVNDVIDLNTGKFYSCGFAYRAPTDTELVSTAVGGCGANNLRIFGGVIAHNFRALRTKGTLRNATMGETDTSANIAEIIIYSPDLWLTSTDTEDDGIDAINGLPPIL